MLDSDRLYAAIGDRIRRLREAQSPRMSQEDLAQVLNLKRTSITNIESGHQKLTLDTLYRLCGHFGLECRDILPTLAEVQDVDVEAHSVTVGGKSLDVGARTASVLARLRPSRSR
jgi:transcriptional regulator with XRE-family HTH domain